MTRGAITNRDSGIDELIRRPSLPARSGLSKIARKRHFELARRLAHPNHGEHKWGSMIEEWRLQGAYAKLRPAEIDARSPLAKTRQAPWLASSLEASGSVLERQSRRRSPVRAAADSSPRLRGSQEREQGG